MVLTNKGRAQALPFPSHKLKGDNTMKNAYTLTIAVNRNAATAQTITTEL